MKTVIYFGAAALLIAFALIVFRVIVRRDYQQNGRTTLSTSLLELLVMILFIGFPYLYNPPHWISFWIRDLPVGNTARGIGLICITIGMISGFGTMIWFGFRRAFGLQVEGLIDSGPYRLTRNPQLLGFSFVI